MNLGSDEEALPVKHEVWEQRKAARDPVHLGAIKVASNYTVSLMGFGRDEVALPILHEVGSSVRLRLAQRTSTPPRRPQTTRRP